LSTRNITKTPLLYLTEDIHIYYSIIIRLLLLLLTRIDTVGGTRWAQRLGTSHAGGGCKTVQRRDEGIRWWRSRRTHHRVWPGQERLVHGRITHPEPRRGSYTGGLLRTGNRPGRTCRMHRSLQASVVRVLDVEALSRLVHGFVKGSPEFDLLHHA